MPRSREQCERLAFEEALVSLKFPGFRFHNKSGDTYVEGRVNDNSGRQYELRIDIPYDFPYSAPAMYVMSPQTLWKYGRSGTLNSEGVTHDFHTRSTGHGGRVQICHVANWHASISIVKLLLMGALWVEASQ